MKSKQKIHKTKAQSQAKLCKNVINYLQFMAGSERGVFATEERLASLALTLSSSFVSTGNAITCGFHYFSFACSV